MKRYASLVILVSLILLHPALSRAADYSGQWLGTITESENRCDNLGKGNPGEYKLTITQKDNEIVAMENTVKRPYTGIISPERPQFVQLVGNYIDKGGLVAELIQIEFTSDTAGTAKSVWRWSSGYYSCGGTFTFTLVKTGP